MTPEEYYIFIRKIQEKEFPDVFDVFSEIAKDGKYFFFAPSYHFRPSKPLLTKEIISDLRDNKKKILSVGRGPAYLERLLISRLGIRPEQIALANISNKHIPCKSYEFDMHRDWPNLEETFDYVIFPESAGINGFSGELDYSSNRIRQPNRESALYRLLVRSLNVLNSHGQIRLTPAGASLVTDPVKERIEAEFPNVEMHYFNDFTYLIKK